MDASCSSGDSEEFVRWLTQKLMEDKAYCQVEDWEKVRKSLGKYEYWQEYMDEIRKICEMK